MSTIIVKAKHFGLFTSFGKNISSPCNTLQYFGFSILDKLIPNQQISLSVHMPLCTDVFSLTAL